MKIRWSILLLAWILSSCTIRPAPVVISKNYEDATTVKQVFLGHTIGIPRWINSETEKEARQRLLDSIECHEYQIVEEGRGAKESIESRKKIRKRFNRKLKVFTDESENVVYTVSHPYIWVRYRCK